jgi:hypothetical protein
MPGDTFRVALDNWVWGAAARANFRRRMQELTTCPHRTRSLLLFALNLSTRQKLAMAGIRRLAQVRQAILKSEHHLVHYLVGRERDHRRCRTPQ